MKIVEVEVFMHASVATMFHHWILKKSLESQVSWFADSLDVPVVYQTCNDFFSRSVLRNCALCTRCSNDGCAKANNI